MRSTDSLIFTISAKDTVWVSISPDIGKGFRGKLAKGEMKRFSANEQYLVFLGNQKAVSMTLGGKPLANLPTIPGSNLVVRNAVITRDKIRVAVPEPNKAEAEKQESSPKKHEANASSQKINKRTEKNLPIKKRIPSIKPELPQ
jgi:hypothetical protein